MIDWDALVLGPTMRIFGEPVTYWPVGAVTPLDKASGVFDPAYTATFEDERGQQVMTVLPVLGVRLAELGITPQQDDEVDVPRVRKRYVVRETRPDGHGHVLLLLNLVDDL